MRLSANILQKIVGKPVSQFIGRGHKRAVGRIALSGPAIIYPAQGDFLDDPFPVSLRDISAETVGVTTTRAMMPHTSMIISIPLAGPENETISIRCRVTRCSPLPAGKFALAAQFLLLCQVRPRLGA